MKITSLNVRFGSKPEELALNFLCFSAGDRSLRRPLAESQAELAPLA
jgi:hypothetical protein